MRALLNVRHHINMGNFEHWEVVGTVEVDTIADADLLHKYEVDPTNLDDVELFVQERVTSLVSPDITDAHFMTAEKKSYAHEYHKERGNN